MDIVIAQLLAARLEECRHQLDVAKNIHYRATQDLEFANNEVARYKHDIEVLEEALSSEAEVAFEAAE